MAETAVTDANTGPGFDPGALWERYRAEPEAFFQLIKEWREEGSLQA